MAARNKLLEAKRNGAEKPSEDGTPDPNDTGGEDTSPKKSRP
jgi:hypothetical protein